MISGSKVRQRVIAGLIGSVYAVVYGFWTLLLTGGGHVNFIWSFLFFVVEFFGLYFPLMAVLLIDLRRMWVKSIYGVLLAFNLIVSTLMIVDWVTARDTDRPSDFKRTVNANGLFSVVIFATIHFLPTLVFLVFLLKTMKAGKSNEEEHLTEIKLS